LKIAVNTRLLIKNKLEGIGWFSFETLKRITRDHPEHEFFFLFDRKFDDQFIFADNVKPMIVRPQARHPFLYFIWFELSIPWILRKIKADLFLSPDGYISLRSDLKSIAVFHDLNFEHYPEDLPWLERNYYRFFFPRFARKANRIATVSEFSKKDIVDCYSVDHKKIDVVYNGANELYSPVSPSIQTDTRNQFSNGHPYFLFIGALHPRKNLCNLFKAFDEFKSSSNSDTKLLIVGAKKWWTSEIRNTYDSLKHHNDVVFTGRLSAEALQQVLGSALALTYISYFEGFGIPIIEAFRAEVPVITSNVTSMPEVAHDAALIIDPFSVADIKDAMIRIAEDPKLRHELINKGKKRRKDFSWDKSAENLWNCIEKTLGKPKSK